MAPTREVISFKIRGMDCAEEITALKREIGPLVGGDSHLLFDLLNAKMTVTTSAKEVTPQAIIDSIARIGMRVEPFNEKQKAIDPARHWLMDQRTLLTIASGVFGVLGFVYHAWQAGGPRETLVPRAAHVNNRLSCLSS